MRDPRSLSIRTAWLLVALILFAPRSTAAQPAAFEAAWADLISEHRRALETLNIVGGTIAFVSGDEVLGVDYYGYADLESGRPIDETTIYHWASITKTFTAVGLMQLRERGLVGLEDPVIEYVPELHAAYNPFGSMTDITLRHLLTHSAGFRSPTWPWGGSEPWHPHEPTEWSQLVAMMPYTNVMFQPGSRVRYSNLGSIFIGRTIEAVTGDVYEAYIDKNIFRPLGMRESYFDVTPWHLRDGRSNNYRVIEGRPVANGLDFNTGITVSNGGLNAPVRDMAKWASFLMHAPGARRTIYEQVLKPATLEDMWQPFMPLSSGHALGAAAQGLHFFVYEADGHRIIGHTGGQKSFRTFIYVDPDADVAIIGAYNTADGDETAPDTRSLFRIAQERARRQLFPLFRDGLTRP